MNTWSEDQNKINNLLQETAELIRTSGQTYATTDTNAASRLNGVGNQNLGL